MNLGLAVLSIVISGYASVRLSGRYLDYRPFRFLYYIGVFIHETSHALLCLATGARIREFSVFSAQPHVTYDKPRLPIIGQALISIAPIAGGLAFLFAVQGFVPHGFMEAFATTRLLDWRILPIAILCLNAGPMLGPSFRDIKNMWPALIIMFFVQSTALTSLALSALAYIVVGLILQIALIIAIKAISSFKK